MIEICITAPIWFIFGILFSAWLSDDFFRKLFEIPSDITTMEYIKYLPSLVAFEDKVQICQTIRKGKENGTQRVSNIDSQDSHLS